MNLDLLKKFNEVESLHWWWEGRRNLLKFLLLKKSPEKILDIGCGTGETLTFLKETFPKCQVYGIDKSPLAVKYSRSRGHKNIWQAQATRLSFKENFFDTVFLLDVLEHVKNQEKAINEAKRVLRKKGEIIITSPALPFIWSDHDANQGHQRRYTIKEIKRIAKKTHLRIVFIGYFNFFLSLPVITLRLLGKLRPFKFFTSYSNGINYNIAHYGIINFLLKSIFITEIKGLRFFKYPWGVSLVAVLKN